MPEIIYLVYLLLGIASGITAGLLGLGGGVVIVPALAMIFVLLDFPTQHLMHTAIATSLVTIIFTAISSSYAHHKKGALRFDIVIPMVPGLMTGAVMGAFIADQLPSKHLRLFFGFFEMLVALQIALSLSPKASKRIPEKSILGFAGIIIGILSTILGIGGGSLTVPYLLWSQIPIRNAVAVSSACGLPIALAGSAGLIIAGLDAEQLLPMSFGYVHWPAAILISLSSIFCAPIGAKLAHVLPRETLKKIFAGVLFLVGLKMIL